MESRNETDLETWDRRFGELLQEIRVAQTGGQILFAFLLTLPFAARFHEINDLDRVVYTLTLVAASISTALLIAPVSYHRRVFRQGRKPELVKRASVLAQCGLAAPLVAFTGAVFLMPFIAAGLGWAAGLGAGLAAFYVFVWYVWPAIAGVRERP